MTAESDSLLKRLQSPAVADQAAVLRELAAKTAVRGLTIDVVRASGSRDDGVRMWAAEALESAITPDLADIDALSEMLYDGTDGEICYWAATMLGRLSGQVEVLTYKQIKSIVNSLETCLSDSLYLPARERAAWALSQIGPPAASATTTLRRTAEDAPPRLQRLVKKALRVIGEAA